MDIYKSHLIKVAVLYFVLAGIGLYESVKLYYRLKFVDKKRHKIFSFAFATFLLGISVILLLNIVPDVYNYNPQIITAKVVSTSTTYQSSFIKENVNLDDKNTYYVYFYNVNLKKGKTYKIIYAPRSKVILGAIEVNN